MNRVRCPNCGAPAAAGEGQCRVCGTSVAAPASSAPVSLTTGSEPGTPMRRPSIESTPMPTIGRNLAPTGEGPSPGPFDLEGTVLSVSDLRHEPADFNAYRFFSILLIILALLPLVLVYIAFRIALAIMFRMMGFRPGMSIFGHFFWIWVGRGAHGGAREMPVINAVVRTPSGEQRTLRIKGHLVRGSLQSGDRVAVNGRWDGGTLLFRSGQNLSTGSELRLRPNPWKPVFFVLLTGFILLVLFSLSQPAP